MSCNTCRKLYEQLLLFCNNAHMTNCNINIVSIIRAVVHCNITLLCFAITCKMARIARNINRFEIKRVAPHDFCFPKKYF